MYVSLRVIGLFLHVYMYSRVWIVCIYLLVRREYGLRCRKGVKPQTRSVYLLGASCPTPVTLGP